MTQGQATSRASALERFKTSLRRFRRSKPGQRFANRYQQAQQAEQSMAHKALVFSLGAVLMLAGLIMLPAPGPGTLVLAAGGALLAQQSLTAARGFDWLELRVRALMAWSLALWRKMTTRQKILLVLAVALSTTAFALACYQLV